MMTPALPSSPDQNARQRELNPVLSAALSSLDMDLDAELARYQLAQQPISPSSEGDVISTASSPMLGDQGDGRSLPAIAAMSNFSQNPFSDSISDYADCSVTSLQPQDPEADQGSVAPETYLASSEELLRSLEEDTEASDVEPPRRRRLPNVLTPLGVGLMLLVSLSSLTVVAILFNARSARLA
ncbi:MAG: hypothetical protein WBA10_15115, partial [Elainellaceae cyanobacterium]